MNTQSENSNTVEQYEKNEKGERKLMNKTKKELIDIIFRKDDVERTLRKELNDLNLDFSKAKDMITKKDARIKDLNELNDTIQHENSSLSNKLRDYHTDSLISDSLIKRLKLIRNTSIAISIILFIAIIVIAII